MIDRLSQCRWPALAEPFASALRDATAFVFAETEPLGVIATGTIIRGEPHATSDLDIYVLHSAMYRRRVQRFFHAVPTEIFINPPHTVRHYLAEEHRDGRLITAHMLATGVIVYEADAVVEQLQAESREWLTRPVALSPDAAIRARYWVATRLEDGSDVSGSDAHTATMLLTQAVVGALEYWLMARGEPIPRSKTLLAAVAARDTELSRLVGRFFNATTSGERRIIAEEIGDRTIGAHGFFAWDSGSDPVDPPQMSDT